MTATQNALPAEQMTRREAELHDLYAIREREVAGANRSAVLRMIDRMIRSN